MLLISGADRFPWGGDRLNCMQARRKCHRDLERSYLVRISPTSGLLSKVYCDFAVQNSLEAAIPQIADAIGDADAATFVHCAAVTTSGPALALDADAMIEALRINTLSWIQITRGVLLQSRVRRI